MYWRSPITLSKISNLTVVIPTYRRERILLDTVDYLLKLEYPPHEILIIDQTPDHEPATEQKLTQLHTQKKILWIRFPFPSIPHAMNVGLKKASHDIVLFLDDDIIPDDNLISAHLKAHEENNVNIIAGRVLQPWDNDSYDKTNQWAFRFSSNHRQWINELMAGNFSIKRHVALDIGGFDENFVRVAYRFEAEFADRAILSEEKILFLPEASIRHLKASSGGVRSYGEHLTTINPGHSVGEYYYVMTSKLVRWRLLKIIKRFFRAVITKHHLTHPWWIPVTLVAESLGLGWAVLLHLRGQRLLGWDKGLY